MLKLTFKEKVQEAGLKRAVKYLGSNPEENLPKILHFMEKIQRKTSIVGGQLAVFKKYIEDKDNNWYRLLVSCYHDIDPKVFQTVFTNLVINASVIGSNRQKAAEAKYNCNIPWAILMDPTSACNLHCIGCWAAEYGNKLNMSYETLDSIVNQGEDLGCFMYIFSGGEPTVRKDDIFRLCTAHPECEFLAFTNATLIDEEFAKNMLRVKNFIPAISIEGDEEATDFRRGQGTYKRIMKGMEILKKYKLAFGASCCYTSRNVQSIGSEAFFDSLIQMGCKFAWFFTYIPVGNAAHTDLMVSAEQREFMYHQVRSFRKTKPLFTLDFWNDGEYCNGCIAGGRRYLHINANGDIEPCAFIHYSDSNIKTGTLLQALQKPLFMEYRKHQPYNKNNLRPCPLLDNPGQLVDVVEKSGAASTDLQSPEDVHELCGKCVEHAKSWAPVADELWGKGHHVARTSRK
ncbi:MAG: radical SAM protein [Sphaerochaetaceae bacterium]|jgi:MoaA/NifB/PqqE/SkfB family radical SAM enzyme|nr:radical SAM protein [Sphaerochaetaceae bacterium]MDD3163023.1 radical SAM protein [Sphaerochaetaceae bacterium]MDD4007225.1 radical SAM protein [Sphaerochaetaceae bacterium]MDD4396323.1 radical SAM protein [Sphaerochaetaceae bacterium]